MSLDLFYSPKNTRKLLVFWYFQGLWKEASSMKWVKKTNNIYNAWFVKKAVFYLFRNRGRTFYSLLVTRYFLLVTRYSLPVTFDSLLVTFYSLLVTTYSLLITFYSLLVPFYVLLVTTYSLLVTTFSLLFTRYFLFVTRYYLPVTLYFSFVTTYLLLITFYSLILFISFYYFLVKLWKLIDVKNLKYKLVRFKSSYGAFKAIPKSILVINK